MDEKQDRKKACQFKPGVSGNPSGRRKRTPAEKKALEKLHKLAPEAVHQLELLLRNERTPSAVKVKICEIILDRTYGKAPATVTFASETDRAEESRTYILSMIERIKGEASLGSGNPGSD